MMRVEGPDTGIRTSAPLWQSLDLADPQVEQQEAEKDDDDSDDQDNCMPLPHTQSMHHSGSPKLFLNCVSSLHNGVWQCRSFPPIQSAG